MKQRLIISFLLILISGFLGAQSLTDSNLPIIIINTDEGVSIPDSPRLKGSMKIIYRGAGQRNYLTDQFNEGCLNYNGRIDIERRGTWSGGYGFSTKMADGITNNNVSLLGMPPENDWILNSMSWDPSYIRDYLCYNLSRQIGEYASRTEYCELIVNGVYLGINLLEEKIKADDNRVNVIKIDKNDVNFPELSGGYITKADKTTSGEPIAWIMYSRSGKTVEYIHHMPKPENVTYSQNGYISSQFFNLEIAASKQLCSAADGFPSIIDIPSFIDYMIISEISSNDDAYQFSTFFHKDRNGKLRAGPIWDNEYTFGNSMVNSINPYFWQFSNGDNEGSRFWSDLFDNSEFKCYLSKRWNELIQPGQPLNLLSIETFIDQTVATINEAVERTYELWGRTGGFQDHIPVIKKFLSERIPWITNNLGSCSSCVDVPVPSLVISKIMYHPDSSIYSADDENLEFIEITNNGERTVDLTGVYFGGTGFIYQFPKDSTLGPSNSVFLASNPTYFNLAYGFKPFGQFTRHLSNKSEKLLLLDAFGNVIDNVHYSDSIPWPYADGNGYYLKLSDLALDNSLGTSWEASKTDITQKAYINVSTEKLTLDSQEGSIGTFIISSNTDWTISSQESWLTLSEINGSGVATITVTAKKNPTINTREAIVTIETSGFTDIKVTITQAGCPTGISNNENNLIRIFPNPDNTILFIEGLSENTQVSIYDFKGSLILKKQHLDGNLDISTFAAGVYIIKLENETESITRRFVKN